MHIAECKSEYFKRHEIFNPKESNERYSFMGSFDVLPIRQTKG